MSSRKRTATDDENATTPRSLTRPISPPRKKRRAPESREDASSSPLPDTLYPPIALTTLKHVSTTPTSFSSPQTIKSPFQLTNIRDLPPELNRDSVTLKDLLGDPLISECWEFNYIHDIDFLMAAFDDDVRHLVKVHVVHGFWKREDQNRLQLQDDASRYKNVTLHAAYLPEMFGTHHTKMLILLRHDDTAQIIIHTANMIMKDWTNMTNGVWSSPMLPLLSPGAPKLDPQIGNGAKFKIDFLNYLGSYDKNRPTCKDIIAKITNYDFSSIRGSLIASVPGRYKAPASVSRTSYGWLALQQSLAAIPVTSPSSPSSQIAIQISSIATLGPTNTWLKNTFYPALSTNKSSSSSSSGNNTLSPSSLKILFPTALEIRRSLDGYESGGSIHTKTGSSASAQQLKQLQYLHPHFCHWANDASDSKKSGRQRAAPHIKTYMRFSSTDPNNTTSIDWALLTSANLSKQAWGDAANPKTGEVRICSYELGILIWPGLYGDEAVMKPSFLTDSIDNASTSTEGAEVVLSDDDDEEEEDKKKTESNTENNIDNNNKNKAKEKAPIPQPTTTISTDNKTVVVSLRMPYDLPLEPYGQNNKPWVATATYTEPDWMGRVWKV